MNCFAFETDFGFHDPAKSVCFISHAKFSSATMVGCVSI